MKRHFNLYRKWFVVVVAFCLVSIKSWALQNFDVSLKPPGLSETQAKPKVILSVDTSGSMGINAYGPNYDITQKYIGMFDANGCYLYDDTLNAKYFYPVPNAVAGPGCIGWDGSFLNWMTMRRIDVLREILIGSPTEIQTAGGVAYTRRDATTANVIATKFIKFISQPNAGGGGQQGFFFNAISNGNADTVSPFTGNAAIHYCRDNVIVTKNGPGNQGNLNNYCNNNNFTYNNDPAVTNAPNDVAFFKLRVLSPNAPTGLIQRAQGPDGFEFGVAVFSGAGGGDGGTMRPCFRQPNLARNSGVEECFDAYAGAPTEDIINIIEYFPIGGGTPIAETLYEIGGYIKQSPQTPQGNRFFNGRSQLGSYDLAANGNPFWDPYFSQDLGKVVECTDVFVININDGAPTGDFGNGPQLTNIWRDGPDERIDSVAWDLRGDCRDDLVGDQDVRSFYVFADLSGTATGQDLQKLRDAAAIGGAEIVRDVNGNFIPVDVPFFPTDVGGARDPFRSNNSGFTQVPLAQPRTTWDTDGNGEPDNLLIAQSPEELNRALIAALDAAKQTISAGGSAALSTTAGNGVAIQGLMYPKIFNEDLTEFVNWTGRLHAIFLDAEGDYREDGNGDGKLGGIAEDPIITFLSDPDLGPSFLRAGVGNPIPIQDINAVWSAGDQFYNLTNADVQNQRAYNVNDNQRYIFTRTPASLIGNAATGVTTMDFVADNFDSDDAFLFDVDCTVLQLNAAGCTEKIRTIVNYIRGVESDETRSRTLTVANGELRRHLLGNITNSSPALVGMPESEFNNDPSYRAFQLAYADRRNVVYVGANDGMLHAFNAGFWDPNIIAAGVTRTPAGTESPYPLGKELWAYVPGNVWHLLQWLADPRYSHTFYVDGSPAVFDVKAFTPSAVHTGGWGTILVVGLGLGGHPIDVSNGTDTVHLASSYIILDITDPERPPTLIDEISLPNLGYTVGKPSVVQRDGEWILLFGSGPTNLSDGSSNQPATLFEYDLATKSLTQNTLAAFPNSFVGDISSVDWDDDFETDNAYFGLVEGVFDGRVMNYDAASGAVTTFYNSNAAVTVEPAPFAAIQSNWLYFGTGKSLVNADINNNQQQSYYGIKVTDDGAAAGGTVVNTTNIVIGENAQGDVECRACPNGVTNYAQLANYFSQATIAGWQIELTNGDNVPGANEPSGRAVGRPLLALERVIFSDFVPPADLCGAVGNSFLYALDFRTGTAGGFQAFQSQEDNTTFQNFIEFGDGKTLPGIIFTDPNGDSTVKAQDGSGLLIDEGINPPPPPSPSVTAQGRVSWRQIIMGL
jgi:hypothetical protein